jgi:hypothetical protein
MKCDSEKISDQCLVKPTLRLFHAKSVVIEVLEFTMESSHAKVARDFSVDLSKTTLDINVPEMATVSSIAPIATDANIVA